MIKISQVETEKIPKSYQKYHILVAYIIALIANNLGFSAYTPIWGSAAQYYGLTNVNDFQWTANMYFITFFALALFTIKIQIYRIDYALYIGTALQTIGTWVIYAGGNNFTISLIGFFFVGIGQIMFYNLPVYICELLYNEYERSFYTSLGAFAGDISIGIAYTFSSIYFYGETATDVIFPKIETLNMLIAGFNSVSLIYCLLFVRYVDITHEHKSIPVYNQIKMVLCNESMMIDLIVFGICKLIIYLDAGVGWSYLTLMSLQLSNFTVTQAIIGSMCFLWVGIIGGFGLALIIDKEVRKGKRPPYDPIIKIITVLGTISLIIETFFILEFNFTGLLFANFFIGTGILSCYPLQLQSLTEKYYPINSVVITTFIAIYGTIIAFIVCYLMMLPQLWNYSLYISIYVITPGQIYINILYITKYNKFELSS